MSNKLNYENTEERYEVTPVELFFDLIYAFAFSQALSILESI